MSVSTSVIPDAAQRQSGILKRKEIERLRFSGAQVCVIVRTEPVFGPRFARIRWHAPGMTTRDLFRSPLDKEMHSRMQRAEQADQHQDQKAERRLD